MAVLVVLIVGVIAFFVARNRERRIDRADQHAPQPQFSPPPQIVAVETSQPAPEPPPVTKAVLVKIDTHGMSKASIAALEAANNFTRRVEITDARTLRRYVPYATDVHSYPITCPYCGWCQIFDGKWVKQNGILTCSRCGCRANLYKTVSTEFDPAAIMSIREREIAIATHPEAFREKWHPHGPGTIIRNNLNISAHLRYNAIDGTVLDTDITIRSIVGFELTTGFKITAFNAIPAGGKLRKFSLWQIAEVIDARNGLPVPDVQEWLSTLTRLPLSPD